MATTGHLSTVTFPTSGFTAAFTELGGATLSRPSLKTSHLQTSNYDTFIPGDLADPGESSYTFYHDPDEQPPITGDAESIVVTFPTGATVTRSGFITSSEEGTAMTNELMMATITIKWSGTPSYADAP